MKNYPIFLKENNPEPITYRVIHSPYYGKELHLLSGNLSLREVNNEGEISGWEFEETYLLFVPATREETIEAYEKAEKYLGDMRVDIDKYNKQDTGIHDTTGGIE